MFSVAHSPPCWPAALPPCEAPLAQATTQRMAFYSGVGSELTHYMLTSTRHADQARRGQDARGIQYAWPKPVAEVSLCDLEHWRSGFPETNIIWRPSGSAADGELAQQGDMVKLRLAADQQQRR